MGSKIPGFLLLFFMALPSFAQRDVQGRVVDAQSGEGLLGAHIYLMNDWRTGTVAGVDGEFRLVLNSTEPDSLVISFVGFEEQTAGLDVTEVRLVPIEFKGMEVVVTAEPLVAEEFNYMKLDKLDIYTNPAAKADPILAVNSLPSATTTDESANISFRGSSPAETGIFINNVPIYDGVRYAQLNGIGTFSIFSTSIIKDVTVFPGNPPLEYGNTTGGLISMSTDDRVLKESTNSMIVSMAQVGFARDQKINDKQSIKLFSNWQTSGLIKAINKEALADIAGFESADVGIYWYGVGKKTNWKVLSYSQLEGYQYNFRHPSFAGIFNQRKRRSFLTAAYEWRLKTGTLSFNNGVSGSYGDFDYSNVAFSLRKFDVYSSLNYSMHSERFSVKTGIAMDRRATRIEGNVHQYGHALAEHHPTIPVDDRAQSELLEVYVYGKVPLSDQFSVGAGLRKNIPFVDQSSKGSGQVNLVFSEGPWTLVAGAGSYYKLGLLESNGQPFFSTSKQVAFDVKVAKDRYQATASFFVKNNEFNTASYRSAGLELFGSARVHSKVNGSLSLTLLNARGETGTIYPFDLGYFVRGNLTYEPFPLWTIESILSVREGTLFLPVSDATYDSELEVYEPFYSDVPQRFCEYLNLGVSVNKIFPISEAFNMIGFLSINNLTNHQNQRAVEYNFDYSTSRSSVFSLRTVYAGAVINF